MKIETCHVSSFIYRRFLIREVYLVANNGTNIQLGNRTRRKDKGTKGEKKREREAERRSEKRNQ